MMEEESTKKKDKKLEDIRRKAALKLRNLKAQRSALKAKTMLARNKLLEQEAKSHEKDRKARQERDSKKDAVAASKQMLKKRKDEFEEMAAKKKEAAKEAEKEFQRKDKERLSHIQVLSDLAAKKARQEKKTKSDAAADLALRTAKRAARKKAEAAKKQAVAEQELRVTREKEAKEAHRAKVKAARRKAAAELALAEEKKQEAKSKRKQWELQQNARWCQCQYPSLPWWAANNWVKCPADTLLVGWHRGSHRDDLASVTHFKCCKACRPDGSVLSTHNCQEADWRSSFDYAGTSKCPKNTYLQGWYHGSCHGIYCLEVGYCCGLKGSRGTNSLQQCERSSWNDYPGWKEAQHPGFMSGLHRTGSGAWSSVRPEQCSAWAY